MTLDELITTRRSIKVFKPDPVSFDLIIELLDKAVFAPNHRMTEPWRFILLSCEAKFAYAHLRAEDARERGKNYDKAKSEIEAVPCLIIVTSPASEDNHLEKENYAATCCAIQNFLLLAWDKGLGSLWKTFPEVPPLRNFLGLADEHVVGVIYLGYPAEIPPVRKRKRASELVRII
jgi:nitroreductase